VLQRLNAPLGMRKSVYYLAECDWLAYMNGQGKMFDSEKVKISSPTCRPQWPP
jgi:hypothetical protein